MNANWRRRWFRPPSLEDLVRVLLAWRWLAAGALAGAALAAGFAALAPSPYRARAEIVVDYNLEEVLPQGTDRRLFYFLSRENKKLLSLAWSDEVLRAVSDVSGQPVDALRTQGWLTLYDERDGRWHFWATAPTAPQARAWVATWAQTFLRVARAKVALAQEAQQLQRELRDLARAIAQAEWECAAAQQAVTTLADAQPARTPAEAWVLWEALAWLDLSATPLPRDAVQNQAWLEAARAVAQQRAQTCPKALADMYQQREDRLARIQSLMDQSGGVSPYTQLAAEQVEPDTLPVYRTRSVARAALAGALLGLGLAALIGLAWPAPEQNEPPSP
ncbi:MAG: hypothetical protein GXO36_04745 [Chloroflexi bacterium]|nr:hypothetical protein [Chloroflexota bacterium]